MIDDSDPNWWKGSNQRGEGLFPANFVSSDLDAEPELAVSRENTKRVQFNEQVTVTTLLEEAASSSEAEVEIDEAKIDRMLHALHEADPTGERSDPEELKLLEGLCFSPPYSLSRADRCDLSSFCLTDQCGAMGPLIDAELEKLDRRHAHLTKLSGHLVEALDMYRALMRELPSAGPQPGLAMHSMPGYPYAGAPAGPGVMAAPAAAGPIKYPPTYPQPQAPPQSPSMQPYAPPTGGQHPAVYAPNPAAAPNPMPYMGPAAYATPFPGHPHNY